MNEFQQEQAEYDARVTADSINRERFAGEVINDPPEYDQVETPLGEQIDGGTEEADAMMEPPEMTDAEADADTLSSAGMGTDEDYGLYSEPYED
jgi:hypothetical protein